MAVLHVAILVLVANTEALQSVCYYISRAQHREWDGKFVPEDIDPTLCTHIVYGFASLEGLEIKESEKNDDDTPSAKGMYTRVIKHKEINQNLKVLLAVGGWYMDYKLFVPLLQTPDSRKTFAENAIAYLRKRKFDGLSMDRSFWGYFKGSAPSNVPKYQLLMETLRDEFQKEANDTNKPRLLLAATVNSVEPYMKSEYQHANLSRVVDFLNVRTYSFHSFWDKKVKINSPMYAHPEETNDERQLNLVSAVHFWVSHGAEKEKINIGIATFGRTYTLADRSKHSIPSPATGAGKAQKYTGYPGNIAYYEVCEFIKDNKTKVVDVPSQGGRYAFIGDQWISYDDIASVTQKTCYAKKNGFGGVFFISLDYDDFKGKFCNNGTYPLLRASHDVLVSTNKCQQIISMGNKK